MMRALKIVLLPVAVLVSAAASFGGYVALGFGGVGSGAQFVGWLCPLLSLPACIVCVSVQAKTHHYRRALLVYAVLTVGSFASLGYLAWRLCGGDNPCNAEPFSAAWPLRPGLG